MFLPSQDLWRYIQPLLYVPDQSFTSMYKPHCITLFGLSDHKPLSCGVTLFRSGQEKLYQVDTIYKAVLREVLRGDENTIKHPSSEQTPEPSSHLLEEVVLLQVKASQ